MIYFESKKWGKSFDALLSSKGIYADEDDIREINKILRKGDTIYCGINPYVSEIDGDTHLIWDTDEERFQETSNRLAEDV